MLPTKFKSTGPLVQEKQKIDFQDGRHGGHLRFPIRMTLAIFDLQVIPMLSNKFQVNWILGPEVKNNCSRWQPSWISDRNDSIFDLQVIEKRPTKFQVNWRIG